VRPPTITGLLKEIPTNDRIRTTVSQEFTDELCREIISISKPIGEVARSNGVGPERLRKWLIKNRDANGEREQRW